MNSLTLDLIKNHPYIFRDTDTYPVFVDPALYIDHFQRKYNQKLIIFSFPDMFELKILDKLKENIYNSFHIVSNNGAANLVTYFQFGPESHAVGMYFVNQKNNKNGILLTFYVKRHEFALNFITENEKLIVGDNTGLGFINK